ncbi:MAG: DUF4091 domain-containing protein [Proteobacteria bacterium]|nr:DUF4091 domain-containing protein [Pseudomonadota bacterium]
MTSHRSTLALAALAAAALLLLTAQAARAELRAIWAVDDGVKVAADAPAQPLARGNGVFSARPARVRLFGARNETVAFQLILVGGATATAQVSVRLPGVGPIVNRGLSADPDRYFVGRRIELFREHYQQLRQRSASLNWEPGSAAEPRVALGWLPDALIPLRAEASFTVAPRRNQGVWVDLFIPPETAPGRYQGRLEVSVAGRPCTLPGGSLPITLEVLPLTLPQEPSLRTMVYFSGSDDDRDVLVARYLPRPWEAAEAAVEALRARHFRLARRHRLSLFIGRDQAPTEVLRRQLSGEAFSRAAGYEGPGEGAGLELYVIHSYGGALTPGEARRWHDWFSVHGARATYFLYAHDEPSPGDFAAINSIARRARPVPSFVTHAYTPQLATDLFAALASDYSPANARRARAAGREQWIYNGVRPFSGSFVVDDVAVSPRVNAWIQYKYGIERWFYWESTYYSDAQGGRGPIDVFSEPITFSNGDGDRLNGDGLLFYPGRDLLFPAQDQGFDLPLPSIRLKNWRRGLQDVEYLVLARRAGHGAAVDRLLRTLIPRALADETEASAPVAWPEEGERWLLARRLVADWLTKGGASAALPATLGVGTEPRLQRWRRRLQSAPRRLGRRRLAVGAIVGGVGLLLLLWAALRRRRRQRSAVQRSLSEATPMTQNADLGAQAEDRPGTPPSG